jgi:anhydro-N-acetylmuramic acid kinase
MSGTSLDGIDAALVELAPDRERYRVHLERFLTVPFDEGLRERLERVLPPRIGSTAEVAQLHADMGSAFAQAAVSLAAGARVDFAATHGLTIYHDGPRATTLQIGRPYELRDAVRATVVWDFRSADCALGGHGAPLVPFVDAILLGCAGEDRVAVNFGGICNLTILPRGGAPRDAVAFDCGPGMMLLDAFVRARTGEPYDRDGRYASAGAVDENLLATLLADPYFALEPPKSTGRERFGEQVLETHRVALERLSIEDGCATLAAFTIRALALAVLRYAPQTARVIAGGGGARNRALLEMLQIELGRSVHIEPSDAYGLESDAKEAIAFAILGYETLRGRAANLPRVTGARAATVLGSIVPHDLPLLLEKIAEEVEASCR